MASVGIWSGGQRLFLRLEARLGNRFSLFSGSHPAQFARRGCDLLIIAPDATGLAGAGAIHAPFALIPGDSPALAAGVRAASAVSYGLGRRNTLTLSSMEGGTVALCLQRELLTLSGVAVEGQEWVLPFDREQTTAEEFLCLVGALLLLDEPLG